MFWAFPFRAVLFVAARLCRFARKGSFGPKAGPKWISTAITNAKELPLCYFQP